MGPDVQTATSSQTSNPSPQFMPYYTGQAPSGANDGTVGILPEAERLYQAQGPEYFPGSTVAGFAPAQIAAQQAMIDRGMQGSPLNAQAGQLAMNTMGGQFLGAGNPYQQAMDDRIWEDVSGRTNALFSQGGRSMSPAHQQSISRGYTEAMAPLHYGTYGQERGMQDAAMRFAPQLAAQDWLDISQVGAAGAQQQQQAQTERNAEVERWNYLANQPYNQLGWYQGMVSGATPGQQTFSSQPYYGPSPFSQMAGLGLGIAGAGAGSNWFGFGG